MKSMFVFVYLCVRYLCLDIFVRFLGGRCVFVMFVRARCECDVYKCYVCLYDVCVCYIY